MQILLLSIIYNFILKLISLKIEVVFVDSFTFLLTLEFLSGTDTDTFPYKEIKEKEKGDRNKAKKHFCFSLLFPNKSKDGCTCIISLAQPILA